MTKFLHAILQSYFCQMSSTTGLVNVTSSIISVLYSFVYFFLIFSYTRDFLSLKTYLNTFANISNEWIHGYAKIFHDLITHITHFSYTFEVPLLQNLILNINVGWKVMAKTSKSNFFQQYGYGFWNRVYQHFE